MQVCLPRDERDPSARADQLASSRDTYRWAYDWPIGVATAAALPRDENYPARYVLSTFKTYAEIGVNLGLMTIEGWEHGGLAESVKTRFESLDRDTLREHIFKAPKELLDSLPPLPVTSWESYEAMFQIWPKPPIVDAFHKAPGDLDRAFAWQRVAGVNPMILARCPGVPANLAVDEALYQRVMTGDSLARATAEGRLYIADYAAFDGLEAGAAAEGEFSRRVSRARVRQPFVSPAASVRAASEASAEVRLSSSVALTPVSSADETVAASSSAVAPSSAAREHAEANTANSETVAAAVRVFMSILRGWADSSVESAVSVTVL